ncbi:hypothetical protein ACB092_06G264100 [Castanea dentata]
MCEPKSEGGMGFKELASFNDALLAKQTWRLLHNHDSLFYKVFKSRFFPKCSILEAKGGHGGSYTWRSILKGREVIRRGARWRVGDGESIKIWGDKWLPSLQTPTVHGPLMAELQEAKVSSLINLVTRQWKSLLLQNSFIAEEADKIRPSFATKQHQFDENIVEKKIWKLPLPCKVRNFLWRACRNAVPMKKNLQRRCVVDDLVCPLCSKHALWSCSKLAQVWNDNNQWSFRSQTTFDNFPQLLQYVLELDCSGELFAMQAWTVWFRRNKVRTDPPGFPLNLVAQRACEALMEYRAAQRKSHSTRPFVRIDARWSPPHDGWFKANFDATTFQEEGRVGIGVIWRDSGGLLGFDRVVFEGDCQIVMNALIDPSQPFATYGLLIGDAQTLANRFRGVKFQYAGRESNKVAHNLARYAQHITCYHVWMEDVPVLGRHALME